jgi:hypothetical protein
MMSNGRIAAALLLVGSAACGAPPTTPTQSVALSSFEYVRVKPVAPNPASPYGPFAYISHTMPEDPYHRTQFHTITLQAAGDNRFRDPFPSNVSLPVGVPFGVEVSDPSVGDSVARDIYINQVLLQPTVFANGVERLCGTVAADGRISSLRCGSF